MVEGGWGIVGWGHFSIASFRCPDAHRFEMKEGGGGCPFARAPHAFSLAHLNDVRAELSTSFLCLPQSG